MSDSTQLISVTDAAKMLGIHPNTVRKRIKKGVYTAEWAPSAHGPQQFLHLKQLNGEGIHPSPPDTTSTPSLSYIPPPAPPAIDAVLEKVLTPFLAQLQDTLTENGRLKAELAAAQAELAKRQIPWYRRIFGGVGEGSDGRPVRADAGIAHGSTDRLPPDALPDSGRRERSPDLPAARLLDGQGK